MGAALSPGGAVALARTPVGYFLGLSEDGSVVAFPDAKAGVRHWRDRRRAEEAQGGGTSRVWAMLALSWSFPPHWSIVELGDLELGVEALLAGFPTTVARLGSAGGLGALLHPDRGGPAWRAGLRPETRAVAAAQDASCAKWFDGRCSLHRNVWEAPPPAGNDPRPVGSAGGINSPALQPSPAAPRGGGGEPS